MACAFRASGVLHSFDKDGPISRTPEAMLHDRLIVRAVIPGTGRRGIRELDDDDALGRRSFEHLLRSVSRKNLYRMTGEGPAHLGLVSIEFSLVLCAFSRKNDIRGHAVAPEEIGEG